MNEQIVHPHGGARLIVHTFHPLFESVFELADKRSRLIKIVLTNQNQCVQPLSIGQILLESLFRPSQQFVQLAACFSRVDQFD